MNARLARHVLEARAAQIPVEPAAALLVPFPSGESNWSRRGPANRRRRSRRTRSPRSSSGSASGASCPTAIRKSIPEAFVMSRNTPGPLRGGAAGAATTTQTDAPATAPAFTCLLVSRVASRLPLPVSGSSASTNSSGPPRRVSHSARKRPVLLRRPGYSATPRRIARRPCRGTEGARRSGRRPCSCRRPCPSRRGRGRSRAPSPRASGRQRRRVELQAHAVPPLHDDVAVVGRGKQLAHVAETRVEARHVRPARRGLDVVVHEDLGPVRRLARHPREAAEEEAGGRSGARVVRSGAGSSSTV